jgi:hypothetical protein
MTPELLAGAAPLPRLDPPSRTGFATAPLPVRLPLVHSPSPEVCVGALRSALGVLDVDPGR